MLKNNTLNEQILNSAIGQEQEWDGGLKQLFRFAAEFIGFQGHFPDNPILPAVVQLQLGVLLAVRLSSQSFTVKTINRAKFMHPIRPEQIIMVYCKSMQDSNKYTVTITLDDLVASSFTITMWENYAT